MINPSEPQENDIKKDSLNNMEEHEKKGNNSIRESLNAEETKVSEFDKLKNSLLKEIN